MFNFSYRQRFLSFGLISRIPEDASTWVCLRSCHANSESGCSIFRWPIRQFSFSEAYCVVIICLDCVRWELVTIENVLLNFIFPVSRDNKHREGTLYFRTEDITTTTKQYRQKEQNARALARRKINCILWIIGDSACWNITLCKELQGKY